MSASLLAEAVPNLAGAAMLLLGLLLPLRRRGADAARSVAWQGALLALAASSAAWGGAGRHLWLMALGALAARALLLPTLLRLADGRAPRDASLGRASAASGSGVAALFAGGALALLAAAAVLPAGAGLGLGAREGSALALAVLLVGLFAMFLGRGLLSGLVGLLAAENGALLALVHAGDAVPGAAALAVLSPGLGGCVALAALRGRGAVAWAPRR